MLYEPPDCCWLLYFFKLLVGTGDPANLRRRYVQRQNAMEEGSASCVEERTSFCDHDEQCREGHGALREGVVALATCYVIAMLAAPHRDVAVGV